MKNKHLTEVERLQIEALLSKGFSLKKIAAFLGKSTSTISREIRAHAVVYSMPNRSYAPAMEVQCDKLSKPPYVCNGCPNKQNCKLTCYKYYSYEKAHEEYREILVEARTPSGVLR